MCPFCYCEQRYSKDQWLIYMHAEFGFYCISAHNSKKDTLFGCLELQVSCEMQSSDSDDQVNNV